MSSFPTFEVATAVFAVFLLSRLQMFISGLKAVDYLPGMRVPFAPSSLFGAITPTMWWNPGLGWCWQWRKTAYMSRTHDIISVVPFISGRPTYYTGSLDVMKQLLEKEHKLNLEKPLEMLISLGLWGDNIISANDEMWKRHRRTLAPAFTPKTYSMVLRETISTYHEMLSAEKWTSQRSEFTVINFNRIPQKLALIMISRCGFKLPMPWADVVSEEHGISFGEALSTVSATTILRLVIPKFMYYLPFESLRKMDDTWNKMKNFMHEFVNSRREQLNSSTSTEDQSGDILTQLIAAWDTDGKHGLSENEVIGNTFALMFAGHETTAHTLAGLMGYLAIHQDIQEKAHQEICSVIPHGRDPTLDDLPKLEYVLACFHEAIRMFPSGDILPRDVRQDIVLQVHRPEEKAVCIKKGSRLFFDMIGIHHDPEAFPDPEKFMPSRWYGAPDSVVSMFGFGPRACIGRKFAVTEVLVFLSMFLRDWRFDVHLKDGESRVDYEARVMARAKMIGLAFGVESFDLRLVARNP